VFYYYCSATLPHAYGFSYSIVFVWRYELEEFVGEVDFEDCSPAIAVSVK